MQWIIKLDTSSGCGIGVIDILPISDRWRFNVVVVIRTA